MSPNNLVGSCQCECSPAEPTQLENIGRINGKDAELSGRGEEQDHRCQHEKVSRAGSWKFTRNDIIWSNIVVIALTHAVGIYGFIVFPYIRSFRTFLWEFSIALLGGFGVTGGVHRYWTHKSFKATLQLRILLAFCYLTAGMNSIYDWVRDHRVHHKFTETDADPHNSDRGFFFSHVGWLMLRKHPEVIRKGRIIDMSDVLEDPVVAFTERYFTLLRILCCFVIPIVVPVYFWDESWGNSSLLAIARYMYILNATWSVNSIAHIWGNKPYDRSIAPTESPLVSYMTNGEGWHNYHHSFPSDYRAAELGGGRFNSTAAFIRFFEKIGWAYDLKVPSEALVRAKILNRGDGTHEIANGRS